MNSRHSLPDLEQTLVNLALDLLRAPRTYPELIISEPLDSRGEISPDAVRMTQHYTAALLAYGFTSVHDELQRAAEWFATPFPNELSNRIDSTEMNRLEALLNLRPQDASVQSRLEKLVQQRTQDGYFDIPGVSTSFATLWALKVLAQAKEAGVLNDQMPLEELRQWSNRILANNPREKDMALALRLRYELCGRLTKAQQERHLNMLLRAAEANGGMWGLSQDMFWMVEHMREQPFSVGDIADHRSAFRKCIIDSCYVIENLMPLVEDHPEVEKPLRQAMDLWWGVFHGEGALDILNALFPTPYDYLTILSRTFVAVRAYMVEPLIQWGQVYTHRQLANQQSSHIEPPERDSIKQALRNWIQIDLEGAPENLKLGMSGASVVRVRPRVANPIDDENSRIPFTDSLIVKYGPIDEINKERESYDKLPAAIKDCFVSIPQPSYVDKGRAFVIMPDLHRYQTVYEIMARNVPKIQESIFREIGPFLMRMHRGGVWQPKTAQPGLLRNLYLLPMLEHVGRIFNYVRDNNLLVEEQHRQHEADHLQHSLFELIGSLLRYQFDLEVFPTAYMHGDLHTRNIMARRIKREQNGGGEYINELDFKLIDLEKFQRDGDPALDAGELLVDLELLRASRRRPTDRVPIEALVQVVQRVYTDFAYERKDTAFDVRVRLAQARALIRVAKGRTKAGEAALRESRRSPAITIGFEVLKHAAQAEIYLKEVVNILESRTLMR